MRSLFFGSVVTALALCLAAGCDSKPSSEPVKVGPPPADDHSGHDHAHPHEGPHGGHLIELGKEEYHAEVTHDEATHTVTLYILDGAAKQAVPIDAKELVINLSVEGKPRQYTLPALPQEGDAQGQSSRFQLANEELCEGLDAPKAKGRLNLTIAGKPYVGQIEAHDHAHGEAGHSQK